MAFPLLALGVPVGLAALRAVTARGIVTAGTGFAAGSILGGGEPATPAPAGVQYARYATFAVVAVSAVLVAKTIKEAID